MSFQQRKERRQGIYRRRFKQQDFYKTVFETIDPMPPTVSRRDDMLSKTC